MKELIRKIINEEISSQVRRRIPTFEETFKHYRKAFIDYKIRNFEIYWNLIMETVSETLYHAWFINTVPEDDWDESEKFIQDYLTKKYYNKTEEMWEKKHRKRLNESKTINYPKLINDVLSSYKDEDYICDIDVSYYNEVYEVAVKIDKKEFEKKYEKEDINYATILMTGYLDRLKRNIIRDIKTLLPVDVLVWFRQINCDKKLNESEEEDIQKNLRVIEKLISMFDYSEVCDMWVEYNSEDGDYEIKSKMSTKNHNTKALEKEFEFLENSIKYLGFTNCYVFRPYYVEECEDEIKYMNESEDKNQSLLSLIDEHGLYEFIKMSGLPLKEIISKTGELSRESLEKYIKDFIEDEAQTIPGSDGDRGIVYPIPLSKTKEVESFYLSKGLLTVEVNEYDLKGKLVAGSIERLPNLTDNEIYKIVKELIDWGGDDDYYEI